MRTGNITGSGSMSNGYGSNFTRLPPSGVTVSGVGTSAVTVTGDETAVNTYLANVGYTPNAGYINANASGGALASGALSPDVLSMSVTTANNTARTRHVSHSARVATLTSTIVSPILKV